MPHSSKLSSQHSGPPPPHPGPDAKPHTTQGQPQTHLHLLTHPSARTPSTESPNRGGARGASEGLAKIRQSLPLEDSVLMVKEAKGGLRCAPCVGKQPDCTQDVRGV